PPGRPQVLLHLLLLPGRPPSPGCGEREEEDGGRLPAPVEDGHPPADPAAAHGEGEPAAGGESRRAAHPQGEAGLPGGGAAVRRGAGTVGAQADSPGPHYHPAARGRAAHGYLPGHSQGPARRASPAPAASPHAPARPPRHPLPGPAEAAHGPATRHPGGLLPGGELRGGDPAAAHERRAGLRHAQVPHEDLLPPGDPAGGRDLSRCRAYGVAAADRQGPLPALPITDGQE
ncbi:hypothetical protein CRUP_036828, partial [Coryphaenoides rupestris]